jgi:drug/metabolite transporter (DMT)-like permease
MRGVSVQVADRESRGGVLAALVAAVLFGASTPFAKALLGELSPLLLAGLLYLGSGVGLWAFRIARDRGLVAPRLSRSEWFSLTGAIAAGGVLAPALLMFGLARASAADASLLLNLEAAFTAVIAWLLFRENAGRRVVLGMALIVTGCLLLSWPSGRAGPASVPGMLAVAGACLCWALDNNLTRGVSAADPVFVAAAKGLVAGLTNVALAVALGARLPSPWLTAVASTVGLVGYGVSLVLFVLALRALGSARTGAYFATAPFVGAAIAIGVLHEPLSWGFAIAAVLMVAGVWLHVTERHGHEHFHERLTHSHPHRHDLHHQHLHAFAWDGREPHTHEHQHEPMGHSHPHFPDLHHRHEH